MEDLLPEGALEEFHSPEQVAERAYIEEQILRNKYNHDQETRNKWLDLANSVDQFYQFLEGPDKNLDIGIEHFERIFLEFQCLEVYKPLYDALIERNDMGDTERARQVQQIYFSTITY